MDDSGNAYITGETYGSLGGPNAGSSDAFLAKFTFPGDLEGDLNGDCFVGIADLNIILGNWNQFVPPGDARADVGGGGGGPDGYVGIDDLSVVLDNWNAGSPPAAEAVPEPISAALFILIVAGTLRRRPSRSMRTRAS